MNREEHEQHIKDFCDLVRKSNNIEEVAKASGIKPQSVRTRIYQYRRKGIPLKTFARTERVDWKALAAYEQKKQGKNGAKASTKNGHKNGKATKAKAKTRSRRSGKRGAK